MLAQSSVDALTAGLAIVAVVVAFVVRLLVVLTRDLRDLAERISWLEAKVNGQSRRNGRT